MGYKGLKVMRLGVSSVRWLRWKGSRPPATSRLPVRASIQANSGCRGSEAVLKGWLFAGVNVGGA